MIGLSPRPIKRYFPTGLWTNWQNAGRREPSCREGLAETNKQFLLSLPLPTRPQNGPVTILPQHPFVRCNSPSHQYHYSTTRKHPYLHQLTPRCQQNLQHQTHRTPGPFKPNLVSTYNNTGHSCAGRAGHHLYNNFNIQATYHRLSRILNTPPHPT